MRRLRALSIIKWLRRLLCEFVGHTYGEWYPIKYCGEVYAEHKCKMCNRTETTIPLSVVITETARRRGSKLKAACRDSHPLLESLERHGANEKY